MQKILASRCSKQLEEWELERQGLIILLKETGQGPGRSFCLTSTRPCREVVKGEAASIQPALLSMIRELGLPGSNSLSIKAHWAEWNNYTGAIEILLKSFEHCKVSHVNRQIHPNSSSSRSGGKTSPDLGTSLS